MERLAGYDAHIEALETECQELIRLRLDDNEHKRKLKNALHDIEERSHHALYSAESQP